MRTSRTNPYRGLLRSRKGKVVEHRTSAGRDRETGNQNANRYKSPGGCVGKPSIHRTESTMFPRAFAVLLLALPLIAALGDADQAKLCNAKAGKLQCCKSVLDLHPAGAKDIMKQLGIKAKKVTGSVGVNCKSVADDGKARRCIAPLQCCTIVKGHIALDCTPTKV